MKNFVEELRWRGMLAQMMPGTEELLQKEMVTYRRFNNCGGKSGCRRVEGNRSGHFRGNDGACRRQGS